MPAFRSIRTSKGTLSWSGSALITTPLLNSCVGWFLWAVQLLLLRVTSVPTRLWNFRAIAIGHGVMFSFDSNKIGVLIKTGKFISWSWNFGHSPRIRIFYSYERNQNF